MIIVPYCLKCTHVRDGMKCDAYPNGIPREVLMSKKAPKQNCNKSEIGYTEKEASE